MTSIAILSDIHSNALALEAVLDDIKKQNITKIFNLGDSLFGPIEPVRTYEILCSSNIINLKGNGDRLLLDTPTDVTTTMNQNRRALSNEQRAWIEMLPETYQYQDFFFCHGTPNSDETYLMEKLDRTGCYPRPVEEIVKMTNHVEQSYIACGHSHMPRMIYAPNGKVILNPGSVGMPAYHDDEPIDHKMESMMPHAKYIIASKGITGWNFKQIAVLYDWDAAAGIAESNGRPDWAFFLRTGRA